MASQRARYLRKHLTRIEKRLWAHLRNRKVAGLKFRRQHPIGDRVVDFFCDEAKLAIELDGSGHSRNCTEYQDLDRELELCRRATDVKRLPVVPSP
jgi:very-short-patch-repair endonuclease